MNLKTVIASISLGLFVLGLTACKSTKGIENEYFAAVVISNSIPADIRRVTGEVFRSHGYESGLLDEFEAVFEKKGSGMQTAAYGSWSFNSVRMRVKVYLVGMGANRYLLRCDAFLVRDAGDWVMEEEQKISKMRRGQYRDLLEEIRAKLNPSASES